jgi:hypothetical protein
MKLYRAGCLTGSLWLAISRLGVGGLRAALDDGYVPHAISGENDKATTMADAN